MRDPAVAGARHGAAALVLFAADHGHGDESNIAVAIREVASGGSASAVLARTTGTDLVLVDVGSRSDPLLETPNYRVRKARAGTRDFTKEPALTAAEFRAAFGVGRTEAELAAKDGMKVVAADALGAGSEDAAQRVLAVRDRLDQDADPVAAMAAVGGADLAAAAGFFARAAELGLVVLIDGTFAVAAGTVAERLAPGTSARAVSGRPPAPARWPRTRAKRAPSSFRRSRSEKATAGPARPRASARCWRCRSSTRRPRSRPRPFGASARSNRWYRSSAGRWRSSPVASTRPPRSTAAWRRCSASAGSTRSSSARTAPGATPTSWSTRPRSTAP
ncbi:nicotinate-nucleotide--dimethylbenzimidazole phosphoribosyltransferase [Frigoriglobus tundricola]|uniref:Nicotinate-nucleotide--dimethylbenzimidazole phosphoribosyltransferase n=1 Tax=Frigoriglobus tundricola TaxID=2774151 RepID=A0A6M5YS80_9BACT|nr:nicotinate-nucleotide--dimethylbenzimidazole phosphoribosyltransferase [Frigoriglobus tundricola]QJW96274.1 Nicotinate-nucleotide--dimethylbenzimidazole phosphoribosyltransferase [Frigoriglobus tundricola]